MTVEPVRDDPEPTKIIGWSSPYGEAIYAEASDEPHEG